MSLAGILSTAVVCGTDMFFLTIGRPAIRLASPSAGTAIMGFFHMFADARMAIWGVSVLISQAGTPRSWLIWANYGAIPILTDDWSETHSRFQQIRWHFWGHIATDPFVETVAPGHKGLGVNS